MAMRVEMNLFLFIHHSDPTKVRVGERNVAEGEVKLLTLTEGRVVLLVPPASAASVGSNDSIDKLFDDGNDVGQEHPTEKDDNVLAKTIAKDASKVVEKTKKSKRKRKATGDASGSTFPPKKLGEDYHAATSNIGGKSLATISGLIPEGFSVSSEVAEPRVVASMTPMLDCGDDGPTDSVSRLNLRTHPPAMRYVVSSDDSHHSGSRSEVNSLASSPAADAPVMTVAITTTIAVDVSVVPVSKGRVKPGNFENFRDSASAGGANANVASSSKLDEPATSSDSFYASQDLDSEPLHRMYVPKWKVANNSLLDDPYVCRDLTDRLAPPAFFSQLRAMDYDQLYTEFNVGVARQMCLGAEVRMRAEHTLEQKDKLEYKCAEQAALLSKKDAEIADLKSLLSLKEAEAAEAIRLRGQLYVVKAADASKGNELKGLKEKNLALEEEKSVLSEKVTTLESVTAAKETKLASLSAQVAKLTSDLDSLADQRSSLESAFELFKGNMEAMQDEQVTVLGIRVAELDAQILEMAAHLEEELYPCFLTTISGRRWILTHGLKLVLLKCLQSSEYLRALGETIGCAINKGMQDGLKEWIDHGKARRDLSVIEAYDPSAKAKYVDAVNALRTGPLAKIPGAEELQPSLEQLMLPINRAEDDVVLGETSLSFPLQVPLSSKSLIGEASTSAIPATTETITTLSTTFASSGIVPPFSVSDYQVSDTEPHDEDPPAITFEKEELDTTLGSAATFHVRGRMFLLRSLSLYTPLPNASVTLYGPSHLVLKVGMPISTGITAFVPYVSENGVSLLLDLIIVRCSVCPFHQAIGLRMFNGSKALADAKLFAPIFKWVITKLFFVVGYYFHWQTDSANYVIPHKLLNLGPRYGRHRFCFYPLGEIINCYD
ncbi:hypothetical protein Tco_0969751 [Tanacetum coccineum]